VACTLTPPPVNSATPRNAVLRLITSSLETFDFMINIVQAPVITSISPAAASRISPTTFEVIISNMPASPAPLFKGNLFSGQFELARISSSSIKVKFDLPPCVSQTDLQLVDNLQSPVFAANISLLCADTQSLLSVVDVDMSALTVTFSLGPWINVLPERSDLNVFISSTASNVRAISLNKQALNFVCDLPFQHLMPRFKCFQRRHHMPLIFPSRSI
jgi:hypothetical protein